MEISTESLSHLLETPRNFGSLWSSVARFLIDSRFSTVICAPIYSTHHGLSTQVAVGIDEGLKHHSSIHCDELVSLPKSLLTDYVGSLSTEKVADLSKSLRLALDVDA